MSAVVIPAQAESRLFPVLVRPAVTWHAKMPPQECQRVGVLDAHLRLSVGIEHIDDLIADFEQALNLSTA